MILENTMFLDKNGNPIFTGNVVRMPTCNEQVHGKWVDYTVKKVPGGYAFAYFRSAAGQILPDGHTGSYVFENCPDVNMEELMFSLVPLQIDSWEIVA